MAARARWAARAWAVLLGFGLALAATSGAGGLGRPLAAGAEASHRAAVVVDTGEEVKEICVRFTEESLTGVELLERAAAIDSSLRPVFASYGNRGKAVCSLCGVGCPASNCFCDGQRFWAYHVAAPGDTSYRASPVGASSMTVRDGDVDAWRWGGGEAAPFRTVEQVCGGPTPAPRPGSRTPSTASSSGSGSPTTTTSPPASGDGSGSSIGAPATGSSGTEPPPRDGPKPGAASTTAPVRSPSREPSSEAEAGPKRGPAGANQETNHAAADPGGSVEGDTDRPRRARASTAARGESVLTSSDADHAGGGTWAGLAVPAASVVALLGWQARLRALRRKSTPAEARR